MKRAGLCSSWQSFFFKRGHRLADIFFSYSQVDREVVGGIVGRLEQRGFSIWWDGKIPPGEDFRAFIDRKLNEAPAICVVWSAESVQSRWVAEEAEEGVRRGNLIPIAVDAADIPRGFRGFQAAQLQHSAPAVQYEQEFEKLVKRLREVAALPLTMKPKRHVLPSALTYRAARNQNLAMTIAFAFVTLAFSFYDFLIDPGNVSSIWFRVFVAVPAFLLFALGYFVARKAWHLWFLNVATSSAASAVIVLQVLQIQQSEFQPGGMGQIVTAAIVLVGSAAGLVHSHTSRAVSLVAVLGVFLGMAFLQKVESLTFWATSIANLTVMATFLWLGFYLRDRRPR